MIRAAIVGASGFVGGELARWLHGHPHVELVAMTSDRLAGRPVTQVHPHLRGWCGLRFVAVDALPTCDLLFLALPHGESARGFARWTGLATLKNTAASVTSAATVPAVPGTLSKLAPPSRLTSAPRSRLPSTTTSPRAAKLGSGSLATRAASAAGPTAAARLPLSTPPAAAWKSSRRPARSDRGSRGSCCSGSATGTPA